MARYKIKLKEMRNADVHFVSLVERPANRIPFRVIKSQKESEMLDLTSIRRMKSDKPVPTVVGIVVNSTDDALLVKLAEAVTEAGFVAASVHKYEDGTSMFAQSELPNEGEGVLIRLSDDVVVVVKNGDEHVEAMVEASALHEALQTEGFFFGPTVAVKAMQEVIATAVKSEGAGAAITKATEQFNAYMGAVSALVPAAALKLEEGVGVAIQKHAEEVAAAAAEAANKKPDTVEKTDEEKAAEAAAAAAEAAVTQEPAATEDAPAAKSEEAKEDKTAELLAAIAGLTEVVTALKSEVSGVKESQATLKEQVTEVAQKAEAAKTAVQTTVVASATKGDEPQGSVQKGEEDANPYFDTAFNRPKRK